MTSCCVACTSSGFEEAESWFAARTSPSLTRPWQLTGIRALLFPFCFTEAARAKQREEREAAKARDRGQNNKSSRGQTTVKGGQRVKSYTYVPPFFVFASLPFPFFAIKQGVVDRPFGPRRPSSFLLFARCARFRYRAPPIHLLERRPPRLQLYAFFRFAIPL